MHPMVLGTVAHFLGHATTQQLHLTQLITVGPGESKQKPHRDQMAFDFFPFPGDVPRSMQHDVGAHRLHRRERRHPHPSRIVVDE